jgi:hypothetical protein
LAGACARAAAQHPQISRKVTAVEQIPASFDIQSLDRCSGA